MLMNIMLDSTTTCISFYRYTLCFVGTIFSPFSYTIRYIPYAVHTMHTMLSIPCCPYHLVHTICASYFQCYSESEGADGIKYSVRVSHLLCRVRTIGGTAACNLNHL